MPYVYRRQYEYESYLSLPFYRRLSDVSNRQGGSVLLVPCLDVDWQCGGFDGARNVRIKEMLRILVLPTGEKSRRVFYVAAKVFTILGQQKTKLRNQRTAQPVLSLHLKPGLGTLQPSSNSTISTYESNYYLGKIPYTHAVLLRTPYRPGCLRLVVHGCFRLIRCMSNYLYHYR